VDDQLLTALKALADASRLAIIGLLAKQPQSVDALSAALGLAPSTVSQHLSKLSQAGLVEMREEQYYNMYSLKPGALADIGTRITGAAADTTLIAEADTAAYDRAVLAKHVMPHGVASFPGGLQKQRAILRWCGATYFERGMRYHEFEVEDVLECTILEYDTNYLRRAMISEKVLARTSNGSWYWRADTPEAGRAGFIVDALAPARHNLSPRGVARQLNNGIPLSAKNQKQVSFDRATLDARMRDLGVRDVAKMRARMELIEVLVASPDGKTWRVTDPKRVRDQRNADVARRFVIDGKVDALPSNPADRLTVLRWFADMMPAHLPVSDRDFTMCWRRFTANPEMPKRPLIEAGILERVDETHLVKYGLSMR
jgi:DNA-binding transcriptional ArsR family regulator